MKDNTKNDYAPRSVRAMRGTLTAIVLMLAMLAGYKVSAAAQTTAASQTTPEKKVEVGVGGVSDSSFKFGEYNGLQNQGPFGVGNFDLRGGAAYDSGSTWRWRLKGTNLGLETRNLSAEFGKQGKFRFIFAYDELLANRSDTYQTPYLGAGTNNLTLPANWIKPTVPQVNANNVNFRSFDPIAGTGSVINSAGVLTPPTAAQLATLANIRANDLPAFHNVDLYTKRTRLDAGFSYSPDQQWDIPISFSHEHKAGRKALGAVSSQVSENAVIIPDLIDFDTEQANASVSYKLKKLFLTIAYYGSFFNNNVKSMTWQDVADPTKSATMASAPSNQFNQLSFTGGYKISANTKLVVTGSYGRNTQNDAFLGPSTAANGQLAFGLPAASLNGLVVTGTLNAKLTAKPTKEWNLSAAYKYDNRDNQTPVNIYLFQDANEAKSGVSPFAGLNGLPATLGSNTNIYENRAYSKQINQLNLQGERSVGKRQYLQGGYDWQKIDRSCSGSWINCADAPTTNEHTLRAEWRKSTVGNFTARLGYAFSWRRGKYDEDAFLALVPMANVVPAGATQSVLSYLLQTGLTGFGPIAGLPATPLTGNAAIFSPNNNIVPQALYGSRNNINELVGMRRYMVADRNRHKVRSNLEWQATEKFSLQGTGDFNDDDYLNSIYGLKKGMFWQASVDASYAASENFVADLFYTYDNQRFLSAGDAYGSNSSAAFQGQAADTIVSGGCFSTVAAKNASAKIDPCLNWSKNNRDKIDTVGFVIRRKNLISGKLELAGEVMFTRARTDTAVNGGSYVNNPLALAAPAPPLPAGTPAVFFIPASDYPTLRNDEITVRPSATYALSKSASLRAFYMFQRLMATDWAYAGLQFGTGTNYLPTNEKSPSYGVHAGGFSLVYTF
ncbi:MAG: MtrB/PioB family decaheme-associated outer membrane protein [Acidobacteriia bacterium]|nr:MtrB/PioB family decaheme-associated outer membrane protein [Terriglobia bacterium]